MKKEIKWGNIPIPGIDDNELDKYTTKYLGTIDGGQKGGNTNKESGHIANIGKQWGKINANLPQSKQASSLVGKLIGSKNIHKITKEQKSKGGKKGGLIRSKMESFKDLPSIAGKQSAVNRINRKIEMYKEILNLIPTDEFTTSDAKHACETYGYDYWKKFLKEDSLIEQTYKGYNQFNPSKYKKKL